MRHMRNTHTTHTTPYRTLSLIALVLALAGAGCSAGGSYFDPNEVAAARGAPSEYVDTLAMTPPVGLTASTTYQEAEPRARSPQKEPKPEVVDPPPPPDGGAAQTRPAARQVIYSAAFRVVVADVPGTLRSIQQAAERFGGHMQEVNGTAITVRVPAGRFNDAVDFVERVGEVVDRQLRAQDVTEEMRDLGIRLDNAEKLRARLLAILEKAKNVEETVRIETELARVAEQIDATKGRIRYLESQIAMSTLRVELNSPVPTNQRGTGPALPFSWVNELGQGLVAGQVQQSVRKAGFFKRGPRFEPPAGFVRYYEDEGEAEAMDADGLLIRVQRHANVDRAKLEFWSGLVRRSLVEGRSLAVEGESADGGVYVLSGSREVGGKPVGYLLAVKRSDKWVTVFEAWGPGPLFARKFDGLRESAVSVDAR